MNKHIAGLCHVALWAFLFLSPLTYWRGTGIKFVQYLMYCMQPLMLMIIFYANYLYLAPRFFVAGKHRYDLLINLVTNYFKYIIYSFLLIQQEALGLNSCLASGARRCDGLTIYGVGAVARHEDTGKLGPGCTVYLLKVARLVGFKPFAEDGSVRLMAYGKEESIDGNVYQRLVGLSPTLNQMRPFHAVFTEKAQGVMLKEDFDVFALHDPLLHHF